jgi:hypothetical protein
MENPKYEGHRDAAATGGKSQSQREHTCPRCGRVGQGNGWLGRHIKQGHKCQVTVEYYESNVVNHLEQLRDVVANKTFIDTETDPELDRILQNWEETKKLIDELVRK